MSVKGKVKIIIASKEYWHLFCGVFLLYTELQRDIFIPSFLRHGEKSYLLRKIKIREFL